MPLLTIEDHKIISSVWASGIRLYGSKRKQIIVEKNGEVVKVLKLGTKDDLNEKLIAAYKYYHERGCVI